MAEKIRWGIMGPGGIARSFAGDLKLLPDAELVAVGSRSRDRADAFGEEFKVPRRHASYEALAQDPDVDVVYVATPHPMHKPCTILCLEGGKAVLCEKPLTVNAREAEEVVGRAREKELFLMEAVWTRFFPAIDRLRELLAEGAIGEPLMVQVDFGFKAHFDPKRRLFAPELAGGSLLDVGVYCISMSHMLFGKPAEMTGLATIGQTGVDEQAAWVFKYPGGQLAICMSAISTTTPHEAGVFGTEGSIRVHSPFWCPSKLTVRGETGEKQHELKFKGRGMQFEAAAVMKCLREGKLEHELMPLDESVEVMRTMDALREQWGVRYPFE